MVNKNFDKGIMLHVTPQLASDLLKHAEQCEINHHQMMYKFSKKRSGDEECAFTEIALWEGSKT